MYVYIHLFQGIIQRRDFVNTLETSMFHKSEELMVQLFNGNSIQGGNAGIYTVPLKALAQGMHYTYASLSDGDSF